VLLTTLQVYVQENREVWELRLNNPVYWWHSCLRHRPRLAKDWTPRAGSGQSCNHHHCPNAWLQRRAIHMVQEAGWRNGCWVPQYTHQSDALSLGVGAPIWQFAV